jgi:hypothetical protein
MCELLFILVHFSTADALELEASETNAMTLAWLAIALALSAVTETEIKSHVQGQDLLFHLSRTVLSA